ncbi:MAG: PilZ domain-containing protein [Hyphomicrobiaceae bacterium]|nr:PilZ domain-containing protein [Hyphomicrobiaceae bacterium]
MKSTTSSLAAANAAASYGTVAADDGEERRSRRKSTSAPGSITFGSSRMSIPCKVLNTSASGACLDVASGRRGGGVAAGLPDRFTLHVRFDRMTAECEIIWREDERVGVRFLSLPRFG